MRIWSLHPKYLDVKGLVALWRETLLAKNVLLGNTVGYKNHPQLARFKSAVNPLDRINQYLAEVYDESQRRGYNFDKNKIDWHFSVSLIHVTIGQREYERNHLLKKLKIRDQKKYLNLMREIEIDVHPLFQVVEGEIEGWEIF
jgi:hypothetical protein